MKMKVQSIHFTADQKLLDFIQEKVDKLTHYHDQIIGGEVFLKLDKAENSENKITEIKLQIPGKVLFAKEKRKTFEEATDLAVEALGRQVKRHKEKTKGL